MGELELILGCVFSGKTSVLQERIAEAKEKYPREGSLLVFTPKLDTRYKDLCTHDGTKIPSIVINKAADVYQHLTTMPKCIFFDEIQFLDEQIVALVQDFKLHHTFDVIASGLDRTFQREWFPLRKTVNHPTPENFEPSSQTIAHLFPHAAQIRITHARCDYQENACNKPAYFTQRLFKGEPVPYTDPIIVLGGKKEQDNYAYRARCKEHHFVPEKPD